MDVSSNKTIKSFLNFKPNCPICGEFLKLKPSIFPFKSLEIQGNIAHITINERPDIAQYTTSVDVETNVVIAKPISNPDKYINGHMYLQCPTCKNYQYRSHYIEYDFYNSKFPPLEVDQEIYYSQDLTLISFLYPKKKSLVYIYNPITDNLDSAELPYIDFSTINLSNNKAVLNKIKNILVLL